MNILWLLFLIAAVLEILGGVSWTGHQQSIGFFLVATIGMNSTHVGLTALLLKLPEYGSELQRRKRLFSSNWLPVLAVTGLVGLFSLWVGQIISIGNQMVPDTLANSLYQALLVFHAVMQTKGLALLYFSGNTQSATVRKSFGWFFGFLFFVSALVSFFEIYDRSLLVPTIQAIAFIFLVGCCGMILKKSASLDAAKRGSFWMFSGRLLLWPLSVYSFSALLGVLTIHGIEYAVVSYRMISKSRVEKDRQDQLKTGALLSILFFSFLALGIPSWTFNAAQGIIFTEEKPLFLKVLLSILIFLTIMHILTDSLIFRFRNSELARSIKPLLTEGEQKASWIKFNY